MKFSELPFGVPCSAKDLRLVFCRVKSDTFSDFDVDKYGMFIIGENQGYVSHAIEIFAAKSGTLDEYLNIKDDFGIVTHSGEIDTEKPE